MLTDIQGSVYYANRHWCIKRVIRKMSIPALIKSDIKSCMINLDVSFKTFKVYG